MAASAQKLPVAKPVEFEVVRQNSNMNPTVLTKKLLTLANHQASAARINFELANIENSSADDMPSWLTSFKQVKIPVLKLTAIPYSICNEFKTPLNPQNKEMLNLIEALTDLYIEVNQSVEQQNKSFFAFINHQKSDTHLFIEHTRKLLDTVFDPTKTASKIKQAVSDYEAICGKTSAFQKFKRVATAVGLAIAAFFVVGFFTCMITSLAVAAATGTAAYYAMRYTSFFKPPLENAANKVAASAASCKTLNDASATRIDKKA
jgi:hypothetical protein